jgi:FkbM family methyltransferase
MAIKNVLKAGYERLQCRQTVFEFLRKLPLPEAIFQHLYFKGPFEIKLDCGNSFQFNHYETAYENRLFWLGLSSYEQTSIEIWRNFAAEATVIVDGGANTGLYSMIAGAANPKAMIFAFEPVGAIYNRLLYNASLNPYNIRAEQAALSDFNGTATFYVGAGEHPVNSTFSDEVLVDPSAISRATIVKTVRLDDYLAEHGVSEVQLVKLDVEGHEPEVLTGLGDILRKSRPVVIAEINNEEIGQRVLEIMRPFNYKFFIINEGGKCIEVAALSPPIGKWGQNFLLCPEEKSQASCLK